MSSNRRDFMRDVGVALATLGATGRLGEGQDQPQMPTCYAPVPPTPGPTPLAADPRWGELRQCWLDLADPSLLSTEAAAFAAELSRRHAAALERLVADGEIAAEVAAEIGVGFGQAVAHVQRQVATCYVALPPVYAPRQDLMQQRAALAEMAERSQVDPATVARARAALERDLTWLARFQAGQEGGDLAATEATPAAAAAAGVLVELLLGRRTS